MPSSIIGISPNGLQQTSFVRIKEITDAGYTLTDDDLLGQVLLLLNHGSAQDLTINTGLIRKQPVSCLNIGAGLWTVVDGGSLAFLNSKGSFLRASEQYSAFTIMPHPTTDDGYYVVGDLA